MNVAWPAHEVEKLGTKYVELRKIFSLGVTF